MTYWRFRAFDETLVIVSGVIPIKSDSLQQSRIEVLKLLTSQNLEGITLQPATYEEFKREELLCKMHARLAPPIKPTPPQESISSTKFTIRQRLRLLRAALFGW
jgi:hypothetical protein